MQARTLIALGLAAASVAAPCAAATKPGLTRWIDAKDGYSITLPDDWYVIPRTTAAIRQEIASLKAGKNTRLAEAFASILASPLGVSELATYRFQAFLWPPLASPVPTEVALQVVGNARYTSAQLPAIGASYARALSGPGAKVEGPTKLRLGAGRSEFIEATVSNGGVRTGVELYIFVHDARVYALSFGIGAGLLHAAGVAPALRSIASAFSFSKTA